jgi:hypothetical protein
MTRGRHSFSPLVLCQRRDNRTEDSSKTGDIQWTPRTLQGASSASVYTVLHRRDICDP